MSINNGSANITCQQVTGMPATWGERFDWLVKNVAGNSQRGLGRKIGTSGQVIGNWIRGEATPSGDYLENLMQAYPSVNPDWLLTGRGAPTREYKPMAGPTVAQSAVEEIAAIIDRLRKEATSKAGGDRAQGMLDSRQRALDEAAQAALQQQGPQSPPVKAPKRKRRSSSGGSDPG